MNFDFSDDQKLFKEQVAKALTDASPLSETRRVLETGAPYSDRAWRALIELGVTAAAVPEAYSGLGLAYYEVCVAAEEIGAALASTPIVSSTYLATEILKRAASEAQKQEWLPRLASGEIIACVARRPSPGGACSVDRGVLSGAWRPVADLLAADIALVINSGRVFVVDLAAEGVARSPLASIDPTRPLGCLRLDGVSAVELDNARSAIAHAREIAAVLLAFEQVGGADRALAMARAYALERRTFGRVIGSYQAIKHKLADVYVQIEIARAHAYYAAWAISTGARDQSLAAAAARVCASRAFSLAAQENIQTHGGMGFTWDSDCQLFYRRARHTALILDSELDWKTALSNELANAR